MNDVLSELDAPVRVDCSRTRLDRACQSAGIRTGTGSAAAFGGAKPAVRKGGLAGTDGREIGAAIDLSSPGPAKKTDGESKGVKLAGNGPCPL